jgi:YD repeat-containing protein
VLPHADSPLSVSSTDHLQIFKEFEWTDAMSASGGPFVYLSKTTATTTNLVDSSTARPLFRRVATSLEDAYGNVVEERITADDLSANGTAVPGSQTKKRIQTKFEPTAPELASWLISLPKERTIDDTPRCSGAIDCLQKTQQRVQTLSYYPDTDLLHFSYRQPGDPSLQLTTELERDEKGNVTGVTLTNAEGDVREVTSEFDQRGLYPISLTRVGEATTQTTQVRLDDRFGTPVAQADPNGIDQTWSYDAFGVQRRHRGPSGSSQIDYAASDFYQTADGFDLPAAYRVVAAQVGGERVEQEYNSFGRLVRRKTFGFKGAEVFEELAYDTRQRLYMQRRPHLADDGTQGAILFGYDDLDRLISEESPDGAFTEHQYGGLGSLASALADPWLVSGGLNATRTLDARTNSTVQVTDRDDLVVHALDALGQGTRYTYGAFGHLTRITDSADRAIALVQDAFGRTTQTYDLAEGGWRTSQFDGFDDLQRTTDAGNRIRDYQYDAYGRLIETNDNDGTTTWTFDGEGDNEIGRLVQTTSPSGQTRDFHYEPREAERNRGLPLSVTDTIKPIATPPGASHTFVTTYHYDDNSRLDRVDYPAAGSTNLAVNYTFDDYGHPLSVQNANAPEQVYWEALSADQGYRLGRERFGTHSCGGTSGTTTTRGYSPATGALTSVLTTCGGNTLQSLSYAYDLAGNLTDRTDGLADTYEGYGYDALNRPTTRRTAVTGTFQPLYSYDPTMGRLSSQVGVGSYSYSDDGRDWIEAAGANHYEHDAVGNIKTRTGPSVPGGSQTIDYTTLDLPSRVTGSSGATQFAYDSAGGRALKQTPASTTFYQGNVYQRTET